MCALGNALATHDHNLKIEKMIEKKGDEDGKLHRLYLKPRFWPNNLLIIAQITDDEDDPFGEETYHIQEGGAVSLQEDGTKGDASFIRDLPPVMFL